MTQVDQHIVLYVINSNSDITNDTFILVYIVNEQQTRQRHVSKYIQQ